MSNDQLEHLPCALARRATNSRYPWTPDTSRVTIIASGNYYLSLELPLTRLDQHDVQPARYLVRSTIYVAHYPRFWYIP
jgi:hypothetical protein